MATAMLQRLRLSSKASQPARKDDVRASRSLAPPPPLLTLPPEIRNAIYDFVAAQANLTLVVAPANKRRPKRPAPIVGLLLVNKQINHEFYPVLLATARISTPITHFGFRDVVATIEGLSQDELRSLAANQRFYLTLLVTHVPRPEELENLAVWLSFRAAEGSHSHPSASKTAAPATFTANTLCYRYDAKVESTRSMAGTLNTKLVLLTALIRHIARMSGTKTEERQRIIRDLAEYKDLLSGVSRTAGEREADIDLAAATLDSSAFGPTWIPQYR
ncbi:hypothetical protein BAUCODRAFT_147733 [Baudoinia panamericana UAMH 10762]|uniref:Uncharacterized protein n=1 Tax=Baudoinia panamericana (strain UAMH 10762) TaxID=717646 RepID=M2LT43_BAUPA|nr:uncharacterized protein BAUCODRAFT_147733 [Baudoinia panamericana UAMH 10762]EMC97687.1 hypothetical protein BAUCODRAFT_147733 [Baudoinia panamericana UAMH 10762]